jgi:flagellar motor switch/type III secretory pathway protein FliN
VLHRDDVARLRVRDVVTLERRLALRVGPGEVILQAKPGSVEARVANGYVPRAMATADDAQMELTVQLGTTRLTLRQLAELAPGAIVSLGRPLSGPFEVRAQGRLIGQGELVDVDGELGVRIVTLQE